MDLPMACCKHFSAAHYSLVLTVRQFEEVGSNTLDVSQKAVARNLAVFGAIFYFFLGQPGCLYSMVYGFMVGMKLRIHVSTRAPTGLNVSFACIRLQETETSHHSCRFLLSFNLWGIYLAKTLLNCDMATMIPAQCCRIKQSQVLYTAVFTSRRLSLFLEVCIAIFCHLQPSSCTSFIVS